MDERYKLIDVRGEGSFGVVYRAFDRSRLRDVAVKFSKSPDLEACKELENEAMLLNSLKHEFIVDLLDEGIHSEEPYIVTEYCDVGSLRRWIGQVHWSIVVSILSQVVQGLQCIHDAGAVHCDIKPENLLLKSTIDNSVVVKIADFGIAYAVGQESARTNTSKGTRGYIAQEVLEGKPLAAAADIYSLGIVATELLTGAREPGHLTMANVPSDLCTLVVAMTNRYPEYRPPLREIGEALEAVLPRCCVFPNVHELEIN